MATAWMPCEMLPALEPMAMAPESWLEYPACVPMAMRFGFATTCSAAADTPIAMEFEHKFESPALLPMAMLLDCWLENPARVPTAMAFEP